MNVFNGMSWEDFLREAVREYKATHAGNTMTDWEIMESLMEHLVDSGLVTKRDDGKYRVPPHIGRLQ